MNEERKIEILNNIKEYMQNCIDKGYHKFVYNDLGYDEKCVDIINAIQDLLDIYNEQKVDIIRYKANYVSKEKIRHLIYELNLSDSLEDDIAIPYLQKLLGE
jgi:hypothetical protein